jgi:phosphotransferase system enzyme I (PtsI)
MTNKKQQKISEVTMCEGIVLEGVTICPGIGIGDAHIMSEDINIPRCRIDDSRIKREQNRYKTAVKLVIDNLHEHIEECHDCSLYNDNQILKIHELMINDKQFHEAVLNRILSERKNAEWALIDEYESIISKLISSRDTYLQARAEDVLDQAYNILKAISMNEKKYKSNLSPSNDNQVVISRYLYVSQIIKSKRSHANGFATESSALSSHAAILLKGYGIPSVGGIKNLKTSIKNGDRVIVDGIKGQVIVRPGTDTVLKYQNLEKKLISPRSLKKYRSINMKTLDGTRIKLMANIDNHHQVGLVLRNRLEGIGMFRTEFLILTANRVPDEEEQHVIYRKVVKALSDRHLIFRTFDLGADKIIPGLDRCTGRNPALGVRGIRRHLLRRPEELHIQLRALLRAAAGTTLGILFPMVTNLNDIIEIKKHVEKVKEELRVEGRPFSSHIKLGAMIEIPAAAIAIQDILSEVDFVNVGTNDLLQYFMAADRDNEAVFHYGDNKNKAFSYLLHFMIKKAAEMGRERDVTICGEMASDPSLITRLIDTGYRSFSITPVYAQSIRRIISNIDLGTKL